MADGTHPEGGRTAIADPLKDVPQAVLGVVNGLRESAFRRTRPVTFPLEVPASAQLERAANGGRRLRVGEGRSSATLRNPTR